MGLALVVVFGLGLAALNLSVKRSPEVPVQALVQPEPAQRPGGDAVPAPPPGVAAATGTPLRLVIRAVEPTWIRVQTDEGRSTEELLPPGATREWSSAKRFLLTVGNAGGIEVELNGRQLPPLGARGAVIQRLELPQPESAAPKS
jgi:cytoskeleton protein RodZ